MRAATLDRNMLALDALAISAGIFVRGRNTGRNRARVPLIAGPIFLLEYPAAEAVTLTAMCSLTGQLLCASCSADPLPMNSARF